MADATVDERTIIAAKTLCERDHGETDQDDRSEDQAKEMREAWATGYVYGPQESELDATCRRHWPKAMCFR